LRERSSGVHDALGKIFGASSIEEARAALGTADVDADEMFWWIEGNALAEFSRPADVAAVFETLAAADMFRRRNEQCMIDVMLSGIVAAARGKSKRAVRPSYKYPEYIALLAMARFARRTDDEMLERVSPQLHCSAGKARTEFLPYLKIFNRRSG